MAAEERLGALLLYGLVWRKVGGREAMSLMCATRLAFSRAMARAFSGKKVKFSRGRGFARLAWGAGRSDRGRREGEKGVG
jgi:hypothetical protein